MSRITAEIGTAKIAIKIMVAPIVSIGLTKQTAAQNEREAEDEFGFHGLSSVNTAYSTFMVNGSTFWELQSISITNRLD